MAWAPTRGIEQVEVQVDDGPWQEAELGDGRSATTPGASGVSSGTPRPGGTPIRVRATDGDGETQTDDAPPPDPDGATGLALDRRRRRRLTQRARRGPPGRRAQRARAACEPWRCDRRAAGLQRDRELGHAVDERARRPPQLASALAPEKARWRVAMTMVSRRRVGRRHAEARQPLEHRRQRAQRGRRHVHRGRPASRRSAQKCPNHSSSVTVSAARMYSSPSAPRSAMATSASAQSSTLTVECTISGM